MKILDAGWRGDPVAWSGYDRLTTPAGSAALPDLDQIAESLRAG